MEQRLATVRMDEYVLYVGQRHSSGSYYRGQYYQRAPIVFHLSLLLILLQPETITV